MASHGRAADEMVSRRGADGTDASSAAPAVISALIADKSRRPAAQHGEARHRPDDGPLRRPHPAVKPCQQITTATQPWPERCTWTAETNVRPRDPNITHMPATPPERRDPISIVITLHL